MNIIHTKNVHLQVRTEYLWSLRVSKNIPSQKNFGTRKLHKYQNDLLFTKKTIFTEREEDPENYSSKSY
jgi:hypothetical protein